LSFEELGSSEQPIKVFDLMQFISLKRKCSITFKLSSNTLKLFSFVRIDQLFDQSFKITVERANIAVRK
ncbi:hypothetical protein R5K22_19330, partial [Acinetobacter baumannii]|nr:hypothetical protein [Acinetobacter baumannii]